MTTTYRQDGETYTTCENCSRTLFWDTTGRQWVHLREAPSDIRPTYTTCRTGATVAKAPRLVTCAYVYCGHTFFYVPERLYPTLCLDHAADLERQLGPWNPANSVD